MDDVLGPMSHMLEMSHVLGSCNCGKKFKWLQDHHATGQIRRPESAWLGNILCRIQTVSTDPNPSPKSKIQNPKSKRGRLGPPQKERRLNWSKIQNPKSEIQNPKSKIRNPKSKIQNPKSKIRNPKSKIQTGRLEFGFWILDLVGPGPGAMAM